MGECRWKSVEVLVCWNNQRLGSRYERTREYGGVKDRIRDVV